MKAKPYWKCRVIPCVGIDLLLNSKCETLAEMLACRQCWTEWSMIRRWGIVISDQRVFSQSRERVNNLFIQSASTYNRGRGYDGRNERSSRFLLPRLRRFLVDFALAVRRG